MDTFFLINTFSCRLITTDQLISNDSRVYSNVLTFYFASLTKKKHYIRIYRYYV